MSKWLSQVNVREDVGVKLRLDAKALDERSVVFVLPGLDITFDGCCDLSNMVRQLSTKSFDQPFLLCLRSFGVLV